MIDKPIDDWTNRQINQLDYPAQTPTDPGMVTPVYAILL